MKKINQAPADNNLWVEVHEGDQRAFSPMRAVPPPKLMKSLTDIPEITANPFKLKLEKNKVNVRVFVHILGNFDKDGSMIKGISILEPLSQ